MNVVAVATALKSCVVAIIAHAMLYLRSVSLEEECFLSLQYDIKERLSTEEFPHKVCLAEQLVLRCRDGDCTEEIVLE